MGFISIYGLISSRRTYEILLEHRPEKADMQYIQALEADIPKRYGDRVTTFSVLLISRQQLSQVQWT
jgi:hypothetical protein